MNTKVNVKKELIEKIRIKAIAEGRSITNYIEQLILKDLK
jgi:predicted HicB family RNase H-like nuclease